MSAVDASADSGPVVVEAPPAPVIGPMAGDPSMLGLASFIAGSIALGLGLVGVVPSSGLLKAGGWTVLVFAALGVYLFFGAASAGTGGKSLPLGKPLLHG